MSSLWSLIRKGREIRYDSQTYSGEDADYIFRNVLLSQPHLVNISQQANEWYADARDSDFKDLDATPCFPSLWLEWTFARRGGVLINRHAVTEGLVDAIQISGKKFMQPVDCSKYVVQCFFFAEEGGYPTFHGVLCFYIDAMGHPLEGFQVSAHPTDSKTLTTMGLMVADVLTTMNTMGTRIEPPFKNRPTQIVKPDRPPFSVWHTIHLPRFARPPLEGASISPEILERREHWVRGHRKDYRSGNGMFGRVKALVWVPEFQRGNPELGTVKQTYKVDVPERTQRSA